MTDIILLFMEARTHSEVSAIVLEYQDKLSNPFNERYFFQAAKQARRRIARIERERRKSWQLSDCN